MGKEKKQTRASIRFGESLYKVALECAGRRNIDISEYVRGLVAEDAAREGVSLSGVDLPGWIIGERVSISHGKSAAKPKAEASGSSQRGAHPKATAARRFERAK